MIDDKVVGDTRDPGREFSGVGVAALLDSSDGFYKSLLKDIVGNIAIFDDVENR